jgi:aerobic carbon-monoxide dehydrogenase medium subunit
VGSTPVRATEAEQALVGLGPDADLTAVADLVRAGLDPTDDVHASGAYRRKVAGSIAVRALQRALEEARNG